MATMLHLSDAGRPPSLISRPSFSPSMRSKTTQLQLRLDGWDILNSCSDGLKANELSAALSSHWTLTAASDGGYPFVLQGPLSALSRSEEPYYQPMRLTLEQLQDETPTLILVPRKRSSKAPVPVVAAKEDMHGVSIGNVPPTKRTKGLGNQLSQVVHGDQKENVKTIGPVKDMADGPQRRIRRAQSTLQISSPGLTPNAAASARLAQRPPVTPDLYQLSLNV